MRVLWLPDILRDAGLAVAVHPGWEAKGREFTRPLLGTMAHHTGSACCANAPCYELCYVGRSDLPGPLCQDLLARDGTFIVEASGRANHAGAGNWRGATDGNGQFLGTEAEHSGSPSEPFTARFYDAYVVGTAAKLRHLGQGAEWACGHKEYALPHGRKPDPIFNMDRFRADVASLLHPAPHPIPVPVPTPPPPEETAMPAPAITIDNYGVRWRFVKGLNGHLYAKRGGDDWKDYGGTLTAGPAAEADLANKQIVVTVRGVDGAHHPSYELVIDAVTGDVAVDWKNLGGDS